MWLVYASRYMHHRATHEDTYFSHEEPLSLPVAAMDAEITNRRTKTLNAYSRLQVP